MNKKILITILIILGLAIIVGGFWYTKNQQKENVVIKERQERNQQMNNEKENKNQNQEEQKNEKEDDKESDFKKIDTSNWKEYCNKEYGLCFKYPKGWVVKENCNPTTYLTDRLLEIRPEKIDEYNRNLIFYIIVSEASSDPKVWYQTKYENPDAIKNYKGETKELKINNLDAYYVVENKDEYMQVNYLISRNNIIMYSTFRVKRNYDSKTDFSYGQYIPYFKSLVYSIK